jgi:hypothetical protein
MSGATSRVTSRATYRGTRTRNVVEVDRRRVSGGWRRVLAMRDDVDVECVRPETSSRRAWQG